MLPYSPVYALGSPLDPLEPARSEKSEANALF